MNGGRQLNIGGGMAISDDGGAVYSASWGDGVYRLDVPVAPKIHSQPSSTRVAVTRSPFSPVSRPDTLTVRPCSGGGGGANGGRTIGFRR